MTDILTLQVQTLERVVSLCKSGFGSNLRGQYTRIIEAVTPFAEMNPNSPWTKMKALAESGPSLTSSKFAYPHIEDLATELLAELTVKLHEEHYAPSSTA